MRAKFVNEGVKHMPGKKLNKKQLAEWKAAGNFGEISSAFENDQLENLDEDFENWKIDYENKIIAFNHNWSDDDYECDVDVEIDFKNKQIRYKGSCENESIQVPGPGYLTNFSYSNSQEDGFDPDISLENFIDMLNDEVASWFGLFSHFAQQEGSQEENNEYCDGCGELEEDCEKCEDCGQCENYCECEEDDEDED